LKMKITFVRDTIDEETEETVEVEEDTTVTEFLKQQGIEKEEVLVSRNGTIISDRHVLEEDDTVKVMDVIAGG